MKNKKKIPGPILYGIILLGMILVTFLIELFGFNFKSVRYGLKDSQFDINSKNVEVKKHTVVLKFDSLQYVNKLKLISEAEKDTYYTMTVTTVSSYGKTEEKEYSDTYYPVLGEGDTFIGKWVKKIVIHNNEELSVKSIGIINGIKLNYDRMLFIFAVLIMIAGVFFAKSTIKDHPERYFIVIGALIGIAFIFNSGSRPMTWDEDVHFKTVYQNSFWGEVQETKATLRCEEYVELPGYNTHEEKELLNKSMDEAHLVEMGKRPKDVATNYTSFAYLPQIAAMTVLRNINISFTHMIMGVKLVNLLTYLLVLGVAIKKAKVGKYALLCVGLLPTSIFQASSITYDAFVFCFISLGIVLMINEIISDEKKPLKYHNLVIALVAIAIGSLSKMVYAPLVLLALLIPKNRFNNKKQAIWFKVGVIAVCGWLLATFVLPAIASMMTQSVSITTDLRGGDTDSTKQLISILKHPVSYARDLMMTIFSFDNFVVSPAAKDNTTIGNLMLLNYGGDVSFPDKFAYVLALLAFVLIAGNDDEKELSRKSRIGIGFILFIVISLIWTALYLAFTPVGGSEILGVQARYYLPFIWLVLITLYTKKIQFHISKMTHIRIALGITAFITAYGMFAVYLVERIA